MCDLEISQWTISEYSDTVVVHGQVDRALDSRSEGLGFDPQFWPCVEVSGKLRIPQCLGPPSRNGYLVHRSKVGSIVAGCIGSHLIRGNVKSVEQAWTLNNYLYLYLYTTYIIVVIRWLKFCNLHSTCYIRKSMFLFTRIDAYTSALIL